MPQSPLEKYLQAMGWSGGGQAPEPPAPAPEYNVPQPPATRQEAIQPMKNYELLTAPERQIFERTLPGVRGSWAGSVMQWAANTPIGSTLLPVFDILAEGVERTSGLMNQMEYYKGDLEGTKNLFQNLSETWKASSLNYNFADLPQLILADDIAEEGIYKGSNIRGIRLPDDMPGVEGLNRAREMLIAGASMEEVEAAFEEEMGALWMRGQMYDMYGHILLDPINYLAPILAPIRKSALASRINKITRPFNVADDIILETRTLLAKAEKAGNMAKVAKYKEILKGQEGLTNWEKLGHFLGGGRELLPDEALKAPEGAGWLQRTAADVELAGRKGAKIPFTNRRLPSAPHTLTPQSRGIEFAAMAVNAVHTQILETGRTVYQMLDDLEILARGAVGEKFGKYVLTPEGRLMQGITHGISETAQLRFDQYDVLMKSGLVDELGNMAKALDTTVDDIATSLINNKGVDDIAESLGKSVDELTEMGQQIKGSPYSDETWKLFVKNDTIDIAERASIAMYGVQQRGKIQNVAGVLKSAETLAWLKLNASFPVKNWATDELFLVSQGITGKMNAAGIDEYWKLAGFESLPERVKQGIGMAGLEGGEVAAFGKSAGAVVDVTMGKPGSLSKLSKWINGIELGPFDMAKLAQKIESKHSAQAFTIWHQKAMKQWWNPGVGFDPIGDIVSPRTLQLMEAAEPGLANKFNDWASSQTGRKTLDEFLDANHNVSMDTIMKEANNYLGYDVNLKMAMPDEYMIKLKVGLPEAIKKGKTQKFFATFRRELQEHLDDAALSLETRMAQRAETVMRIEGPQGYTRLLGAAIDDYQGFHLSQATDMAQLDAVLKGASPAARAQYFENFFPRNVSTWKRANGRMKSILKGIRKGTDGKLPQRVVDNFNGVTDGWQKFYKVRNADYKKFFDATKKGKMPFMPWEDLKAKHNGLFLETTETEARLYKDMFEAAAAHADDPAQAQLIRNIGQTLGDSRAKDKLDVIKLQDDLINAPSATARQRIYNEFWSSRFGSETHTFEQAANAAMQGNAEAAQVFARAQPAPLGKAAAIPNEAIELAEKYRVAQNKVQGWASQKVAESQRVQWQTKLDELEEAAEVAGKQLDELGVAREDALITPAQRAAMEPTPVGKPQTFLPDTNIVWPEDYLPPLVQDQYWFTRGHLYIDAIEQAAIVQAGKKPLKIAKVLPKEAVDEVASWLEQTQVKYGGVNNAAVRMGEYGRDAALLNYNRRYNYNTWLGTVAPYEFWMTQSMMKWGLHSIDHPAMLSTYFRYQKMLETVGAPNQQIPSRLRDHFEVELPFLDEKGPLGNSIWVNPTRLMLPFEQYSYPFQDWNRRIRSREGRAEYLLNEWVDNGTITQLEAEDAIDEQGGDLWRRAINEVEGEGSDLQTGPFEFATTFSSLHAPLMWAYYALKNEKEKISPIMPLTRYSKAAQGLLGPGIPGDIAGAPHSVEAKIRTTLGLPAFDEWDDYRVERMMTNLAGDGKYPYEEVMRQWIAKEGPIWDEAKMLSDKEFGISGLASAIGLSLKAYPPGEKKQRLLQTELRNAFEQKEANPDAEVDPVWQFYQEHPEYSARQALWAEPEERMQKFMLDLIYDKWNDMPTIHKKQVREVIGDDIDGILYPDEAEAGKIGKDEIPIGILQNWLMVMGGDVPGENEGFAMPVDFIDPVIANRAQVYYDSINQLIPEFWDVSGEYYDNPENLRKQWGRANPEKYAVMKAGWDFKRDWLWRNPDVAPYITDNEDWWREFSTIQEREEVMAQTPDFNPAELIAAMPQEAQRLVYDFAYNGDDLPESIEDMLDDMAQGMGITLEELLNMLVDNR